MKVTHVQITELSKVPGTEVISVNIGALIAKEPAYGEEVARVVGEASWLMEQAKPPRVIILGLDSTISGNVVELSGAERAAGLEPGGASALIPGRLGDLGRQVVETIGESLAGVYLTGGDIMVNTMKALGASGIRLVDYVVPQADQGVIVGGPSAGLSVVCKGGLTGTEQTAIQCVNRIFDEKVK